MAEGPKDGLVAAVEQVLGKIPETQAGAARVLRAEQLALIPSAAELAFQGDPQRAERDGPGRPPGSRNKRTGELVRFIAANYRHPLMFLAETFNRPALELARELGCSVEEAFKMQLVAAKELAPYVAQKQPIAVQVQASGEVRLTLVAPEKRPAARPGDGAKVINATVENQPLSAPLGANLDREDLDR